MRRRDRGAKPRDRTDICNCEIEGQRYGGEEENSEVDVIGDRR
jgi:hypothetical protein